MDRIPSQRERPQMSMFPSVTAHWTVPHAEGAEIGGSVSELGSQREGAEFEDLFLTIHSQPLNSKWQPNGQASSVGRHNNLLVFV